MKSYTTAILFLCSVLVARTAAQSPLETTILRIQEANPTALIGMATQRLSEANFQVLANAVGTVFAALNSLALPDISQKLLNLDGSVKVLSQSTSTLSTNLAQLDKNVNARIDALQLAINPVIQELKSKISVLETSVAQLVANNCCTLVSQLNLRLLKLEGEARANYTMVDAKIKALTSSMSTLSSTLQTTKASLEMQIKTLTTQFGLAFKALDESVKKEAAARQVCCDENKKAIDDLKLEVKQFRDAEAAEEDLEKARFDGIDKKIEDLVVVEGAQNDRLDILETFKTVTYPADQKAQDDRLDSFDTLIFAPSTGLVSRVTSIEDELPKIVHTSDFTNPAYKLVTFDFNGFASTTAQTSSSKGFDITSSATPAASRVHIYTVTIPAGLFANVPSVSTSITYRVAAPANPESIISYSTSITLTSFNIVVARTANALSASNYNVQVILYGN